MAQLTSLDKVLNALGATLGLDDAELAAVFGVQPRTIERWRAGVAFPQHESRQRLEELSKLSARFEEAFKTREGAQKWLRSPSGYFGGMMPLDALLRSRIDLVDAAIEAMESGVFV